MTQGFKDENGKFRPTENRSRGIRSNQMKRIRKNNVTPSRFVRKSISRDNQNSQSQYADVNLVYDKNIDEKIDEYQKQSRSKIKQVKEFNKKYEDKPIDHTVDVQGYEIEIPEGEDEYDIVDDFFKYNKLFKPLTSHNKDKFEMALEEFIGTHPYPSGSVYLTTDGKWVGGIGSYGYDEDHRPQIRKALVYSGLELPKEEEMDRGGGGNTMVKALEITGMIRAGTRGNELSLDIYKPLTQSQINSIRDFIIEKNLTRNDIYLDLNGKMENINEDRIYRQFMPDEFKELE